MYDHAMTQPVGRRIVIRRVRYKSSGAFTLIELLVVIAIIALLIAILLPTLLRIRKQARAAFCQVNLKQWGTILNLYTEDNRGCFPVYDNDFGIIWFLRGAIANSDGEDVESLQPVETRGIAYCPTATKPGRIYHFFLHYDGLIMEGWHGRKTFDAWEMISPGRPFRVSYGFNGWLFCCDFDASVPFRRRWSDNMTGIRIDTLKGRGNIPLLLDSVYPYSHPGDRGRLTPPRKEGSRDFGGWGSFSINRHNEHINGLFLDWSVRKVGIKELWTLKWNMQFDTANKWTKAGGVLPEDWPEWMRKFKDY